MSDAWHLTFITLSAVILFLYGLEQFSREMQAFGQKSLQGRLDKFASNRWRGFLLGAGFTALVQSSSAASTLAVSLVQSGLITFRNSLALLFGANVGTTLTAQLVAFKLTGIGPYFIVAGFVASLIHARFRVWGRMLFYFGFIFFSLDLISGALAPVRNSSEVLHLLRMGETLWIGILAGAAVTFVVQSSSVTTGLIVLLVQQGQLGLESAVPLVLGTNIGTTGTALIAASTMGGNARRAAFGNACFNVFGVLLFIPFVQPLAHWLSGIEGDPAKAVANLHFTFNIVNSLLFLFFLRPFERLILRFTRFQ